MLFKGKRTSIFKSLMLFTISVLLFTSCSVLLPEENEVLAPPLAEPPQPKYSLYAVKRGDLVDQFSGGGTFIPVSEYNLNFGNNAGRLLEVNVKSGDFVKKDDLLAKLDVEDLEYSLSQLEVDLKKTRLSFDKMKIDYNKLISDIKSIEDEIANSQDDTAKNDLHNRLNDLNRQKEKSDIDMEIHKLNIQQQEANYQRTLDKVKKAELRAPVDGIINFTTRITIGDWINTWQNLFTLVDPSTLYLRAQSSNLERLQLGMKTQVTIGNQAYEGIVATTPNSSNLKANDDRFRNAVIITVDDLPETVMPGDNASIVFIFDKRDNVLVIPKAGLRTYGSRNYVLLRKDDVNREVDIVKGMETPTMVEVLAGIDEGDEIILR